jgi:hypothetical protein
MGAPFLRGPFLCADGGLPRGEHSGAHGGWCEPGVSQAARGSNLRCRDRWGRIVSCGDQSNLLFRQEGPGGRACETARTHDAVTDFAVHCRPEWRDGLRSEIGAPRFAWLSRTGEQRCLRSPATADTSRSSCRARRRHAVARLHQHRVLRPRRPPCTLPEKRRSPPVP